MPNWVINVLYAEEKLKDKILNDKGEVDFNVLIPMPPNSDEFYADGNLGDKERQRFGKNNWYDWSLANWGVKWNAYDSEVNGNCYKFETACCVPIEWLYKLSEQGDFVLLYSCEDSIYTGILEAEDGQQFEEHLEDKEKIALYGSLWGYDEFELAERDECWLERVGVNQEDPAWMIDVLENLLPDRCREDFIKDMKADRQIN